MDLVLHKDHAHWRALLKGQFTFSDNTRFRELLDEVKQAPPTELIIDVEQVSYIDSAALGMLLLLRETATNTQMRTIIAGAGGQVLKIFELSRFGELFELI